MTESATSNNSSSSDRFLCQVCTREFKMPPAPATKLPSPLITIVASGASQDSSDVNAAMKKARTARPSICGACKKFYSRSKASNAAIFTEKCTCPEVRVPTNPNTDRNPDGRARKLSVKQLCRSCRARRCHAAMLDSKNDGTADFSLADLPSVASVASAVSPEDNQSPGSGGSLGHTPVSTGNVDGRNRINVRMIPCEICGVSSSGYHFGVISCEGCKGFFRRSICKKTPYKCKLANRPIEERNGREHQMKCKRCRFDACIATGMSLSAVQTGRHSMQRKIETSAYVKRLAAENRLLTTPIMRATKFSRMPGVHKSDVKDEYDDRRMIEGENSQEDDNFGGTESDMDDIEVKSEISSQDDDDVEIKIDGDDDDDDDDDDDYDTTRGGSRPMTSISNTASVVKDSSNADVQIPSVVSTSQTNAANNNNNNKINADEMSNFFKRRRVESGASLLSMATDALMPAEASPALSAIDMFQDLQQLASPSFIVGSPGQPPASVGQSSSGNGNGSNAAAAAAASSAFTCPSPASQPSSSSLTQSNSALTVPSTSVFGSNNFYNNFGFGKNLPKFPSSGTLQFTTPFSVFSQQHQFSPSSSGLPQSVLNASTGPDVNALRSVQLPVGIPMPVRTPTPGVIQGLHIDSLQSVAQRLLESSPYLARISDVPEVRLTFDMDPFSAWTDVMNCLFDKFINAVSSFVRLLPGFRELCQADRVVLFSQAYFPILVAQLSLNYDMESRIPNFFCQSTQEARDMLKYLLCGPGDMLDRQMNDAGFTIATWKPNTLEFSLFCGLLYFDPTVPDLADPEKVRQINAAYIMADEAFTSQRDPASVSSISSEMPSPSHSRQQMSSAQRFSSLVRYFKPMYQLLGIVMKSIEQERPDFVNVHPLWSEMHKYLTRKLANSDFYGSFGDNPAGQQLAYQID